MATITPFPSKPQPMPDVWPWSIDATVAAGLLVAFWLGVLLGWFGNVMTTNGGAL